MPRRAVRCDLRPDARPVGRPVLRVVSDRSSCDHDAPPAPQMSLPKVLDPHRMRAEFPTHWANWLRAEFGSGEHVAVAFGVTFNTACNWLGGVSRPTGDKVALVMMSPDWRRGLEAEFRKVA